MLWSWIKNFSCSDPSLDTKVLWLHQIQIGKVANQVEWETGEITYEPLSIIAADDPVTCAAYAKENDLLAVEGWHKFMNLARAIKQSKIRQVRRSQTYMLLYLIPRNNMDTMQFDSENKNSKWYEMESMLEYKVFIKWDKAILDKHKKVRVVGICISAFPCMLHHAYLASYSTSSLVES